MSRFVILDSKKHYMNPWNRFRSIFKIFIRNPFPIRYHLSYVLEMIFSSSPGSAPELLNPNELDRPVRFFIYILSGSLNVGDSFYLFVTRHPIKFRILDIQEQDKPNVFTLIVNNSLWGSDGWQRGTVVDTEDYEVAAKYGYGGQASRDLYHPDILEPNSDDIEAEQKVVIEELKRSFELNE